MTPTCANPGIGCGGGFVGESKSDILGRLGTDPRVLPFALIPPGPADDRAAALDRVLRDDPRLGGYPVILKPDAGQRGFAVRLVEGRERAAAYFGSMRALAIAQRYDPGPHECGVVWARRRGSEAGFVYAVTRKEFPIVTGDGVRTIATIVREHPRFSLQSRVFLARLGARAQRVPAPGEAVRLGLAGNHCQGALFRDGRDLLTPAFESAIDGIARGFRGGLDYGRFDVRYESEAALGAGRFTIVELNGATGEPTSMYDPDKGLAWALGLLAGQWRLLYELGAERRRAGSRPMRAVEILGACLAHLRERSGEALAD